MKSINYTELWAFLLRKGSFLANRAGSALYPIRYNSRHAARAAIRMQCLRQFGEDGDVMLGTNSATRSAEISRTILGRCRRSAKGVEEIHVADDICSYRVIYFARRADAVYLLLYAFQKKTQATPRGEIGIAKKRLAQVPGGGR